MLPLETGQLFPDYSHRIPIHPVTALFGVSSDAVGQPLGRTQVLVFIGA